MFGIILLFVAVVGVVILGAAAVTIDRLNFPQRPFRPQQLPEDTVVRRDRTGAHIVDDT